MNHDKILMLQRARALTMEAQQLVLGSVDMLGLGAALAYYVATMETRLACPNASAGPDMQAASFVLKALGQVGKPYVFGAEVKMDDPNPAAFDCSELVQWAAHQVGVGLPDGTMFQLPHCQDLGTAISFPCATLVRGALLFRPGHVAISLGDGRTVEARGKDYGVGVFSARGRGWTHGALVPGMRY